MKRIKRLLIENTQEKGIICDNPKCDYSFINPIQDIHWDGKEFINRPCPLCGENLLTKEDYLVHRQMVKLIDWINKWFSWIMFFYSKNPNRKLYRFHPREGLTEVDQFNQNLKTNKKKEK